MIYLASWQLLHNGAGRRTKARDEQPPKQPPQIPFSGHLARVALLKLSSPSAVGVSIVDQRHRFPRTRLDKSVVASSTGTRIRAVGCPTLDRAQNSLNPVCC